MNPTPLPGQRVIIAGDHRVAGRLARLLVEHGYPVSRLGPPTRPGPSDPACLPWDGSREGPWMRALDGAAAIINLWGPDPAAADGPTVGAVRAATRAVYALGTAVRDCAAPPGAWVQLSSLAVYGRRTAGPCDESCPGGDTPLARACLAWEEALGRAALPTMRWAAVRLGRVVRSGAPGGEAPVAGRELAAGDFDRIMLHLLGNAEAAGVYNGCAPSAAAGPVWPERTLPEAWRRHRGEAGRPASSGPPVCLPAHLLRDGFAFDALSGGHADRSVRRPAAIPAPNSSSSRLVHARAG